MKSPRGNTRGFMGLDKDYMGVIRRLFWNIAPIINNNMNKKMHNAMLTVITDC